MTIKKYLKDKLYFISITGLVIVFLMLLFGVTDTTLAVSVTTILCVLVVAGSVLIVEWKRRYLFYKEIDLALDNLEKKYFIHEMLPKSGFLDGDILLEIMNELSKSIANEVSNINNAHKEYLDFVEMWIHEVKTPLAAISLITSNNKSVEMVRVKEEVKKVEKQLEQILFHARSSSLEKDYIIQSIDLEKVVRTSVKDLSTQFISKNIILNLDLENTIVYSDPKWLEYIFKQILENALKYSDDGKTIIIRSAIHNQSVQVDIIDEGIGISESDIKRVFDRGFTGQIGRNSRQATGFGLYLVKTLSERLGIGLSIVSDKGTTVSLVFPKSDMNFR
ncbi:HAMP domain-containing histidine kinase [Erysipelothrix sp. HDW6A]|uniref:sensor histidine kinase n=1 Tax=Erysipelothrix sp. HDW6A TaxID=2714928 RepID=UPI00140C5D1B|nr:sensor histidine kinase [Erysipelothrix sp. HDW6A]QIK57158.1 HAMP domain-containing histidine kinase [Erysipelothrix sp. HDW6A]